MDCTGSPRSLPSCSPVRHTTKGSTVKVAVRIRNQCSDDEVGNIPPRFRDTAVRADSDDSLVIEAKTESISQRFIFDRVLDNKTQTDVYEWVSGAVDSFLEGYNTSILCYGQSGSGKSYTMGTEALQDETNQGICPRAANQIFEALTLDCREKHTSMPFSTSRISQSRPKSSGSLLPASLTPPAKTWKMHVTMCEIYQESLRDLLDPNKDSTSIIIREDSKGGIVLAGLKTVEIETQDQFLEVLNQGNRVRQTGNTDVNSVSSRSHAIFSCNLVRSKLKTKSTVSERRWSIGETTENYVSVSSKLHFVDLAGSERIKKTKAEGERAKEGISINMGLASLGKVIWQLSTKGSRTTHVSYRDSKLTRILQDSLGGTAVTYLIATVHAQVYHLSESLNTLLYAQKARKIRVQPKIQISAENSADIILQYKEEIRRLEERLNSPGRSNSHHTILELDDLNANYEALQDRYAKLAQKFSTAMGSNTHENPVKRMARSQEIQTSVDKIIEEYESLIKSLESGLTTSRLQLAETEGILKERNSQLSLCEHLNKQLTSRMNQLEEVLLFDCFRKEDRYDDPFSSTMVGSQESNSFLASQARYDQPYEVDTDTLHQSQATSHSEEVADSCDQEANTMCPDSSFESRPTDENSDSSKFVSAAPSLLEFGINDQASDLLQQRDTQYIHTNQKILKSEYEQLKQDLARSHAELEDIKSLVVKPNESSVSLRSPSIELMSSSTLEEQPPTCTASGGSYSLRRTTSKQFLQQSDRPSKILTEIVEHLQLSGGKSHTDLREKLLALNTQHNLRSDLLSEQAQDVMSLKKEIEVKTNMIMSLRKERTSAIECAATVSVFENKLIERNLELERLKIEILEAREVQLNLQAQLEASSKRADLFRSALLQILMRPLALSREDKFSIESELVHICAENNHTCIADISPGSEAQHQLYCASHTAPELELEVNHRTQLTGEVCLHKLWLARDQEATILERKLQEDMERSIAIAVDEHQKRIASDEQELWKLRSELDDTKTSLMNNIRELEEAQRASRYIKIDRNLEIPDSQDFGQPCPPPSTPLPAVPSPVMSTFAGFARSKTNSRDCAPSPFPDTNQSIESYYNKLNDLEKQLKHESRKVSELEQALTYANKSEETHITQVKGLERKNSTLVTRLARSQRTVQELEQRLETDQRFRQALPLRRSLILTKAREQQELQRLKTDEHQRLLESRMQELRLKKKSRFLCF